MKKQHSPRFLSLIQEVKTRIREISPQELQQKLVNKEPLVLIDVREDQELTTGCISNAIHLSKGILERDIEKEIPDPATQIILYCSGGFRCALAAESLQKMGYSNVYSLNTGLQGWLDAGFQLETTTR